MPRVRETRRIEPVRGCRRPSLSDRPAQSRARPGLAAGDCPDGSHPPPFGAGGETTGDRSALEPSRPAGRGGASRGLAVLPRDDAGPSALPPRSKRVGVNQSYPSSRAVAVAQLVEPRVVVPVVAGSSPVRHPSSTRPRSSVDRATDFESVCGGSTPPGAIGGKRSRKIETAFQRLWGCTDGCAGLLDGLGETQPTRVLTHRGRPNPGRGCGE
jgi:hypothetical protein